MTNCFNEIYLRYNLHQFPNTIYINTLNSLKILSLKLQNNFKTICEKRISTSYYH